ncbi:MAG: hypothetical protein IIZ25_07830 [Thermoguttaceae bacterium]|nr:hypothetical protein [Thermoguttaceae bacterium]
MIRLSPRRRAKYRRFPLPARPFIGLTAAVCLPAALLLTALTGCGTTKWSDTSRTATEQLLISSAMDEAIDEYDFYPLTGRKVFIESAGVSATDKEYLLTMLRQQLAANGVFIQETKETADYILEVATGAVGTNRYDLMYGIPETSIPSVMGSPSTSLPEIPIIKRTDQKAQVKLTMWAYNKTTGAIIWQSGEKLKSSWIRDRWILGAGPFSKNSFSDATEVGGREVKINDFFDQRISGDERPSVRTEAVYRELDTKAIDHLEEIRKEGIASMTKKAPEAEKPADGEGETIVAEDTAEGEKPAEGETDEAAEAKEDEKPVAEQGKGDETVEKTAAAEEPPVAEDDTAKAAAGPLVQIEPRITADALADTAADPPEVPTLTVVTIPAAQTAAAQAEGAAPPLVALVPAPAAAGQIPLTIGQTASAVPPAFANPAIGQGAATQLTIQPSAAGAAVPRLNLGDNVTLQLGQPVQLIR